MDDPLLTSDTDDELGVQEIYKEHNPSAIITVPFGIFCVLACIPYFIAHEIGELIPSR